MYTDATARTPRTAAIQDAEDLCRQYPNKCSSWLTLYKAKVKIDPFYKPDYEFEQMKNRCDDFNGDRVRSDRRRGFACNFFRHENCFAESPEEQARHKNLF